MTQDGQEEAAADSTSSASPQCNQRDDRQAREQLAPVANHSVHQQIEPGFPKFALFPAEIRRQIWNEALDIVPRVHFLVSPGHSLPDHMLPGFLKDAGHVDEYSHHGLREEMATLVATHANYTRRSTWSVPGCQRYRRSFSTIKSPLSRVCPESRDVVQQYKKQSKKIQLSKSLDVRVDEDSSIFCIRMHPEQHYATFDSTSWLLLTEPQLAPRQLAIELKPDPHNIGYFEWFPYEQKVLEVLPFWWKMALRWGREAREETASGIQTAIKPPPEALAINLEHLTTLFLVSYGVLYQGGGNTRRRTIPACHYTNRAMGVESEFFILDPDDEDVLQY